MSTLRTSLAEQRLEVPEGESSSPVEREVQVAEAKMEGGAGSSSDKTSIGLAAGWQVIPNPREYMDLIESLGQELFTDDQEQLFRRAQQLRESKEPAALIRRYIQLVLSTRLKLEDDPELDRRLVTAASNAISVLHYGSLCGLIHFHFYEVQDWNSIRIPAACLNLAMLRNCDFSHADLSMVKFFRVDAHGCNFRGSKLVGATTYESNYLVSGLYNMRGKAFFSPNGEYLAIAEDYRRTTLWRVNLQAGFILQDSSTSETCAFSHDSQLIALGSLRGKIYIHETSTGRWKATLKGHNGSVQALAFSPDGTRLASGSRDGIRIWSVDEHCFTLNNTVQEHKDGVAALAFSPDSKTLASAGRDNTIRLWDLDSMRSSRTIKLSYISTLLSFSQDGQKLAWRGKDPHVIVIWDLPNSRIWNKFSFEPTQVLLGATPNETYKIEDATTFIAHDTRTLDTCSQVGINVWHFVRNSYIHFPILAGEQTHHIHEDSVLAHAVTSDHRFIAECQSCASVKVYDLKFGEWLERFRCHLAEAAKLEPRTKLHAMKMKFDRPVVSPNGQTIAIQDTLKVLLFDIASGRYLGRVEAVQTQPLDERERTSYRYAFTSAWFSSDGKELWTASCRVIATWDVATCMLKSRVMNPTLFEKIVSSPVGRQFAVLASQQLNILDMEKKQVEPVFKFGLNQECDDVKFSHNGKWIAAAGKCGGNIFIYVREVNSTTSSVPPTTIQLMEQDERGYSVDFVRLAFSPDSYTVATGGPRTCVYLWNLKTKQRVLTMRGHEHVVTSVAFSADGRYIISSDIEGSIRVWDKETGACLKVVRDCASIASMMYYPEQSLLLTTDGKTLRLWNFCPHRVQDHLSEGFSLRASIGINTTLDLQKCDIDGAEIDPGFAQMFRDSIQPSDPEVNEDDVSSSESFEGEDEDEDADEDEDDDEEMSERAECHRDDHVNVTESCDQQLDVTGSSTMPSLGDDPKLECQPE